MNTAKILITGATGDTGGYAIEQLPTAISRAYRASAAAVVRHRQVLHHGL